MGGSAQRVEHLQKPWMFDCRSVREHFQAFLIRPRLSISGNGAYYLSVMCVEIGNALTGVENRHWAA
ncbi:hypothetical protein ALP83_101630 [Pseudomonas syringae pv. actinidiae]|uniref:Uncharacterized protein n=1 Tax=Pseudomonas syringae pv. actinidiae TaxID=103796 RepID=A0A7Z6UK59_PSESF|nr:hypothetical protein ALP83_101630 [Pseudomonas syringae pv. actinidiae]